MATTGTRNYVSEEGLSFNKSYVGGEKLPTMYMQSAGFSGKCPLLSERCYVRSLEILLCKFLHACASLACF